MHAISNFCTALSAQNLNTPVEKTLKTEKNAANTTIVTSKIMVENLQKITKELFSGERNTQRFFNLKFSYLIKDEKIIL